MMDIGCPSSSSKLSTMFFKTDHTRDVESSVRHASRKVCDQISDTILGACLTEDSTSRGAGETFGGHHLLVIGGEVTSTARPDYEAIGRQVYKDVGYTDDLKVIVNVAEQSPDIGQGVDTGGAGDQGIMYGYATNETKEFLPWALVKVHPLPGGLQKLREAGTLPWLMPDGKSQISMQAGKVSAVLVSTQHKEEVSQEDIKKGLVEH